MVVLEYLACPMDFGAHIAGHTCITAPPVTRKPDPRHSRKPLVQKLTPGNTAWRRRYGR